MHVILSYVFLVGLLGSTVNAEQTKESRHTIDHPNKNEYASVVAGSDKHKYGYELKENRHFHHTTTEEDGVRLGCYGYVLFGKKYSTQYVADVRGYRPVYTHDAITVYPKSGGQRKASFIGDFNEDQQRSENIRYFFPDGCKGSDIVVPPGVNVPMILPTPITTIKGDDPVTPSKQPNVPQAPKVFPPSISPFDPPSPPKPTVTAPPAVITTPEPAPVVKSSPVFIATPRPQAPNQKILTKIPAPTPPSTISKVPNKDTCAKSCCSDDDSAKLVIPVPLKNTGKSGSCEKFAKLIIPVEGLNPDSLKSLTKGSDTTELIKTILQSLA